MNTHKPTILFVHPDLRGGGAEKVLVNLLNSLDSDKFDITLLTYFEEGVNRKDLNPNIKQKTIFKKVFRGWSVVQKIFSPTQLYKLFIKEKYDVVVAYLEGVPTRMVSGCPYPETKLVSWLHIDLKNFGIEKVFRSKKEMNSCYHKFDRIAAVSKRALESLFEITDVERNRGKVIHNVVKTQHIVDNGAQPLNTTMNENVINLCSVGRLTRQKGYERLVNVMAKLVNKYPNVHLYLLGDGELKGSLQNQISQLNLNACITLLGFQSNPHKYVTKCDLFVCSSFEEGFSTAVTESVILGTPVLTTACAGMDEILEDGNIGMIVDNSEEGLYKGLNEILSNPELLERYAIKTKEKSKYFQANNNAKKAEELLLGLLAPYSPKLSFQRTKQTLTNQF